MDDGVLREKAAACASDAGADLVGFCAAEELGDPALARIFPEARTVIAIAFRVLRGSYRGIEEGSTFYQYTTTGVETLEETLIPAALLEICTAIEDGGYQAVPQRRNQSLRASERSLNPEMLHTEWYPAGEQEPQLDFARAAAACGLGELGRSGALLTDEFGPFQRVACVLTDAPLEPTPRKAAHLCDGCGECERACPGRAVGGGKIDAVQCAAYYRGANMHTNPYMPPDAYSELPDRDDIIEGRKKLGYDEALRVMADTHFYPAIKHGYAASICGRACDRACYAHLEEKGALIKTFENRFRKAEPWELPIIK